MGRRPIYANDEERKAARRESFKRYRAKNKNAVMRSQLKHWAKRLREAGWTVIEPIEK